MTAYTDYSLDEKLREFEKERKNYLTEAIGLYNEFIRRYSFREHPEKIDELTPEKIYNPGAQDYFIIWIELKLRNLGRISVGSSLYAESARGNPEKFKQLLKVAIDPALNIAEKIDAPWESIRGFGGDKLVAKKIVFCYNPEKMLPIFKTDHLEHFASCLQIDYIQGAHGKYGKSYNMLSTGQKCELLNGMLFAVFKYQETEAGIYETLLPARFLYETYPPQKSPALTKRAKMEPLHSLGALFQPECEQEVVYLFSVLHRDLGFPYVLKLQTAFPDCVVINKNRETKTIEFEVIASDFIHHGHPKEGCDFIVCWENDLDEPVEGMPEIISLKDYVSQ
ncbi:MAG TPA: hypothetical protein VLH40_09610 [Atribacteraceae bacterium]|nr:hypothetical protein [Atribacteraceae bacterium]